MFPSHKHLRGLSSLGVSQSEFCTHSFCWHNEAYYLKTSDDPTPGMSCTLNTLQQMTNDINQNYFTMVMMFMMINVCT